MSSSLFDLFKDRMAGSVNRVEGLSFLPKASTVLVVSLFLLISLSLLMIASASIPFATKHELHQMYFFRNQLMYVVLGLMAGWAVYKVPLKLYCSFGFVVASFITMLALLFSTLILGSKINGATRWISLGVLNFQVAELCKAVMVLVTAEYVVRRSADVRESLMQSWRLAIWFLPTVVLLMAQPDYGSFVMVVATALVIIFVSGVPVRHIVIAAGSAASVFAVFALSSSYRRERVMAMSDPFSDVQDTGYQLANSLIAFGRGGVTGVGYGDSVQKLSHLPEAHTDFLLAITAEELGVLGVLFVLLLEFLIIASIMAISYTALKRRQLRLSYTTFGFAVIIFGQTVINAGMNMGLLPTKGLTLPFYSYGGSSMLIMLMMIGYILQVDKKSESIFLNKENSRY